MRFRLLLILFFTFTLLGNSMHPIHVTVTNIDFNLKDKAFDVSIKLFPDDFEGIISKKYNVFLNLGKPNETENANKIIEEYVRNNFSILVNDDKFANKKLKLIKKEINEGSLWLFFNYSLSKKIETLQVFNSLLNDYYPDMTNLVIIKLNDSETGYSLNKNTTSFKIPS
jgi:hypothetical protein